jgi:dTDP-4-dehydrorhamnose 3,5-epimerase
MKFTKTKLNDVYIVEQNVFKDNRGSFVKTFQQSEFIKRGLECDFKESYYTKSKEDVIRGMHFQVPPHDHAKLVTITQGSIVDVILDLRLSSSTYGEFIFVELSRENRKSVYIPRGCAHGFGVISDIAISYYMTTTEHNPKYDEGLLYDSFGFDWHKKSAIQKPIISNRDSGFVKFDNFISPFV